MSLLLILSFSSSAAPLFWKAEKEHQQLFLMGTIHIGHDKLDPFSHDVIQALELADGLIVETKLDEKVHFPQDQQPSVEQILDDDTLSLLQQILRQSSLNQDSILRLPPWQVALTLQQLQFQSLNYHPQFGIDIQLSQWAQKQSYAYLWTRKLAVPNRPTGISTRQWISNAKSDHQRVVA